MIEVQPGDSNTVSLAKTMLNLQEALDAVPTIPPWAQRMIDEGVTFAAEVLNDLDPEEYSLD